MMGGDNSSIPSYQGINSSLQARDLAKSRFLPDDSIILWSAWLKAQWDVNLLWHVTLCSQSTWSSDVSNPYKLLFCSSRPFIFYLLIILESFFLITFQCLFLGNINNPVELSSKRDTDGTSVISPTSLGLDAHDIMSSKQQW